MILITRDAELLNLVTNTGLLLVLGVRFLNLDSCLTDFIEDLM